ncbi:MAG: hypothetical protein CSA97_03775 [Bacteroidetes bacterium]|nr:MAG: hypothetical protein CSA97_03775 [Bacteroidota bacterium]
MGSPNRAIELEDLLHVARLAKPHGIKGGVVLRWHAPFSFDSFVVDERPYLFVVSDGLPVPYRLSGIEETGKGITVVYFDGLDNPSQVEMLGGREVYAYPEAIDVEGAEYVQPDLLEALVGVELHDQHAELVGTIVNVADYSMNIVLTVERPDGREVLVPLSEELVVALPDEGHRSLQLEIPEGLLEVE